MKNKEIAFLDGPIELCSLDPCTYAYFDSLLNKRTVIFNQEVNESILESVIIPLLNFEKDDSDEPVTLVINTQGGDPVSGSKLLTVIDEYTKKLNIVCYDAMSMGAIIMCAGSKNPNVHKSCYALSNILFHDGSTTISAESGTTLDIIRWSEEFDNRLRAYVLTHTSVPAKVYDEHKRKQWFLSAKEMLEYGIVDEIIGEELELEENK